MRIVLDTNVLARTTPGPSSPAREVLRRAASAPHVLLMSHSLLSELSRVLRYERLRKTHGLSNEEIDRHVRSIEGAGVVVPLPAGTQLAIVERDPDDDSVIATAIIGQADVLCTLDRHLFHADVVAHCRAHAIEIMNDIDLLRVLREEERRSTNP